MHQRSEQASINSLPNELYLKILRYLNYRNLFIVSQLDRRSRAMSGEQALWKDILSNLANALVTEANVRIFRRIYHSNFISEALRQQFSQNLFHGLSLKDWREPQNSADCELFIEVFKIVCEEQKDFKENYSFTLQDIFFNCASGNHPTILKCLWQAATVDQQSQYLNKNLIFYFDDPVRKEKACQTVLNVLPLTRSQRELVELYIHTTKPRVTTLNVVSRRTNCCLVS